MDVNLPLAPLTAKAYQVLKSHYKVGCPTLHFKMPVLMTILGCNYTTSHFINKVYNLEAMLERIKKDPVFFISGILAIVSCFFVRPDKEYLGYIDFRVLAILFSMMLVIAELVQLGAFDKLTNMLLSKVNSSRLVALVLVWLSFFLSMIMTNDVTLVTLVPFAIAVMKSFDDRKSLTFTLILMTVAANLGSMQTPIGNPQNIYLYTRYQIGVFDFMKMMFPYSLCSLILVTVAVFVLCKDKKMEQKVAADKKKIPVLPLIICLAMFAACLLVVARVANYLLVLAVLAVVMFVMNKKAFRDVDYTLLITFCFFFVFVGNVGRVDYIHEVISGIVEKAPAVTAIISSQVISNVPAALLLSAFTQNGEALVIGTNLGGLGTLIASMASLITYKFNASLPKTEGKSVNYIGAFSVINILFLAVLLGVYYLIR